MAVYPNPYTRQYSDKYQAGYSDTNIASGVYRIMGASLVGVSMTLGFNNNASSLDLTLVEDTVRGDSFVDPHIPSIWGFSLPSGGVGQPSFYPTLVGGSADPTTSGLLCPNDFDNSNVPMYFAGICTKYDETRVDIGGKEIRVSLTDAREILGGVQVIIGGFGLSQNFEFVSANPGSPRASGVGNIIDAFGYWDHGMESARNENGMVWDDIKTAIEAARITVYGMEFEFVFTGDTFEAAPDWYRVNGEIMDLNALCTTVATDSGSDFICVMRKMNEATPYGTAIIEIRGIKRTTTDQLTTTEINSFLAARDGIVRHCNVSREFRNEDNSKIIVGGYRNKNYLAYPATYTSGLHVSTTAKGVRDNYHKWPPNPIHRYFEQWTDTDLNLHTPSNGAIFPFWGFAPSSSGTSPGQVPMAEPFLALDHIAFDLNSDFKLLDPSGTLPAEVDPNMTVDNLRGRIPVFKIEETLYEVRQNYGTDCFLSGDGDTDFRPWAFVSADYAFTTSGSLPSEYVRGLPLNTEVLRASLQSAELFFHLYSLHYPDISQQLGFGTVNWLLFKEDAASNNWLTTGFASCKIGNYFTNSGMEIISDSDGTITSSVLLARSFERKVLSAFISHVYQAVRNFAQEYYGKQFLVCLPRSEIMHRLWNNPDDPLLPTRKDRPEIEYRIDSQGYFEVLPDELDGLVNPLGSGSLSLDQENQIIKRFQVEDGRFQAMAFFDWKPSGDGSFNSNGTNKLMFQDIPVSEFRPNRIAEGNPAWVAVSCNAQQLVKRPDLALVSLPVAIQFDPSEWNLDDDENFLTSTDTRGIFHYFAVWWQNNADLRTAFGNNSTTFWDVVVNSWTKELRQFFGGYESRRKFGMNLDVCLDPKLISIPLTSTWVTYGPWYFTDDTLTGRVGIEVHDDLVPWNFDRPDSYFYDWDYNLETAGFEMLNRNKADLEYVDTAVISCAGLPEFGLGDSLHSVKKSNITGMSISFGTTEISTTYDLGTYIGKPGSYRKADYDNISKFRLSKDDDINNRTVNMSLFQYAFGPSHIYQGDTGPRNQFRV